ncbi:MAG TPA: helix-turn-helix transcriptional regulator [Rugosimonospora sp.]|nr:helix-turn-helix transcriptional regulator [Rugosimonospora sp.]
MTESLGDTIAGQIRRYRKMRDLSIRELAEECERIAPGTHLTAASLTNIERGQDGDAKRRRRDVTVEELLLIAVALQVPPVLLIAPLELPGAVQVVPGQLAHSWNTIQWISGRMNYVTNDYHEWFKAAEPLVLYQRHDDTVRSYVYWADLADDVEQPDDSGESTDGDEVPTSADRKRNGRLRRIGVWLGLMDDDDFYDDDWLDPEAPLTGEDRVYIQENARIHAASALARLIEIRATMRRSGLRPPILPAKYRHLDPAPTDASRAERPISPTSAAQAWSDEEVPRARR